MHLHICLIKPRKISLLSEQTRHFDLVEVKDFDFGDRVYDCVWTQWIAGYIPDPELIAFLRKAKRSLRDERSVIVLKDNLSNNHQYCIHPLARLTETSQV
jgi:hypothetical protein